MIVRRLITLMSYEVDKGSEKKAEKSVINLKNAARGLAAALTTGVVAVALRRIVRLGSDAQEAMNVLTVAFEEQTGAVVQWARDQSVAMGRSEFMLRKSASSLGAMITPMVESTEVSAEMSTNLAQLAVDLGSFFDVADKDALVALKSGIVGEMEPMRRFGVVMTIAAMDAFALSEGLGKTIKEMTEAEKVALRYRFIMARTSKAQGDAARTGKNYANLVKALGGVMHELGTEIGMVLVPSAEKFLIALISIAREIKGPVISGVQRFLAVAGKLERAIALAMAATMALIVALKIFGTQAVLSWLAAIGPMILFIALIGAVGLAIFALVEDLQAMGEGNRSVIGGMIKEFEHLRDETGSITGAIGEMLLTAFKFWGEKFSELFGDEVIAEFDKVAVAIEKFLDRVSAFFRDEFSLADLIWGKDAHSFEEFMANLGRDLTPVADFARGGEFGREARANPAIMAGLAASVPGASSQNIEVTVQAAPGMNEGQLADMAGAATGRAVDAANRRTSQRLAVGGGS